MTTQEDLPPDRNARVARREAAVGAAGVLLGVIAFLTASVALGFLAVVTSALGFGMLLTRV